MPAGSKPGETAKPAPLTEVPANDRIKLHRSAQGHVDRVAKGIKGITPEGEKVISDATIAAEENEYLDRAKVGAKPEKRIDAAKRKGAPAARTAVDKVAVEVAEKAADQAMSDGSVYVDLAQQSPQLRGAINAYEGGTTGQTAKRLSPQLEGKTASEMKAILDTEVAAKNAMIRSRSIRWILSPSRDAIRSGARAARMAAIAPASWACASAAGSARNRSSLSSELVADRLEQIVDRGGLERTQGVLVVRGREHDHQAGRQPRADLEAIEIRHRDIEEHEIEIDRARDRRDRRVRIARLPDDLDAAGRFKHPRQPPQRERLVIDEKHPPHSAASGAAPGNSIVTPAPTGISVGATTRAAEPYSASSRARNPSSP